MSARTTKALKMRAERRLRKAQKLAVERDREKRKTWLEDR